MKTILFGILTASIAAKAAIFPQPLESWMRSEMARTSQNRVVNVTSCADFTGNWKGECEVSGSKFPADLQITQAGSCTLITIAKEVISIGSLETRSHSHPIENGAIAISGSYTTGWSEDGSTLQLKGVGQFRSLKDASMGGAAQFDGKMFLEGDKLNLGIEIAQTKSTCVLSKQ